MLFKFHFKIPQWNNKRNQHEKLVFRQFKSTSSSANIPKKIRKKYLLNSSKGSTLFLAFSQFDGKNAIYEWSSDIILIYFVFLICWMFSFKLLHLFYLCLWEILLMNNNENNSWTSSTWGKWNCLSFLLQWKDHLLPDLETMKKCRNTQNTKKMIS